MERCARVGGGLSRARAWPSCRNVHRSRGCFATVLFTAASESAAVGGSPLDRLQVHDKTFRKGNASLRSISSASGFCFGRRSRFRTEVGSWRRRRAPAWERLSALGPTTARQLLHHIRRHDVSSRRRAAKGTCDRPLTSRHLFLASASGPKPPEEDGRQNFQSLEGARNLHGLRPVLLHEAFGRASSVLHGFAVNGVRFLRHRFVLKAPSPSHVERRRPGAHAFTEDVTEQGDGLRVVRGLPTTKIPESTFYAAPGDAG